MSLREMRDGPRRTKRGAGGANLVIGAARW
jgi:hypothetical protein